MLKVKYMVVPENPGIWTMEAYISQSKRRYDSEAEAKVDAYEMSKRYGDVTFLVMPITYTVSACMKVELMA